MGTDFEWVMGHWTLVEVRSMLIRNKRCHNKPFFTNPKIDLKAWGGGGLADFLGFDQTLLVPISSNILHFRRLSYRCLYGQTLRTGRYGLRNTQFPTLFSYTLSFIFLTCTMIG